MILSAMWLIFLIISVALLIISLFAFKRFSPIPYFPSNEKDMSLIIQALGLRNNQVVFDLGAGDGIVIFEAAKKAREEKLNTKFVAVEINPVLTIILYLRRFFHPNKKNIKIVWGDMFKNNFNTFNPDLIGVNFPLLTFYLYISPWFLNQVSKKILSQFPKAKIVSYMYLIKSLKTKRGKEKIIRGKNNIYIYDQN